MNIFKSKKSQITVFIIFGLLILILFYFIYFLAEISSESGDSDLKPITNSKTLIEYTKNCLQSSLQSGLILIGQQGGYIYRDQPGSILTLDIDSVSYENNKIPYLISTLSYTSVPQYPCLSSGNPLWHCNFINNISLFPELYNYYYGDTTKFLQLDYIKKELKSYIELKTKECTDFSQFNDHEKYPEFVGIEITSDSSPSADILFGPEDVAVTLKYPILIKSTEGKAEKELIEVYTTENIHFKKIYSAVKDILEKDNFYLDYNLKEDTSKGEFFLQWQDKIERKELEFNKLKDSAQLLIIPVQSGDIIQIIDDNKLQGEPYLFQFARKNRPPVLDFIDEIIINDAQILEILPKAADPDEDDISFSYDSGWRSSKFQNSKEGYVSFAITREDIGAQKITLSASDSEYSDYQSFFVQVCGLDSIGELPDICLNKCGSSIECDKKQKGILSSYSIDQLLFDKCSETCQFVSSSVCSPMSNPNCKNKEQYFSSAQGWCYDESGCNLWCTAPSPIVDSNNNDILDPSDSCGCAVNYQECDSYPYNYNFEGYCLGYACKDDN